MNASKAAATRPSALQPSGGQTGRPNRTKTGRQQPTTAGQSRYVLIRPGRVRSESGPCPGRVRPSGLPKGETGPDGRTPPPRTVGLSRTEHPVNTTDRNPTRTPLPLELRAEAAGEDRRDGNDQPAAAADEQAGREADHYWGRNL